MSRSLSTEIIASGTELLLGDSVDTNSAFISQQFRDLGIDVYYHTTVGDNARRLQGVIEIALTRANLIIITGGLGPTVDDVTREAVAASVGQPLVFSPELLQQIAARFARFGRTMSDNNRRQAYIPAGAEAIPNPVGTAPAFRVEKDGAIIIALPGVPAEMRYLMEHAIIPYLRRLVSASAIVTRVLHTAGIGESQVDSMIGDLMTGSNPTVGLAAHPGQTDIRITAKASSLDEARLMIQPVERTMRQRLGSHIYGTDGERIASVLARIAKERCYRLAITETLTGGLIAQELIEAVGDLLVAHVIEPSPAELSESLALAQAQALQASSGAHFALVSLASEGARPGSDDSGDRQAVLAVVGCGQLVSSQFGFGGHAGLFQPWVLNQSLYLLWRAMVSSASVG